MPIKTVIESRVPIKVWTDSIEEEARVQLKNTGSLPFVFKHVAVMPDVHFGIGATVGSVVATRGAICPACVGVDIGCGMMAVKTSLSHELVQENIFKIRHSIERSIPVGFNENKQINEEVVDWFGSHNLDLKYKEFEKKALAQMGTLGGGNHFIEICLDAENTVWIMLHSGSRGIGNKLARLHIEKAKGTMKQMFIELPDPDLAYFAEGTKDFEEYFSDLSWCQEYALQNREQMMSLILKDLSFAVNNRNKVEVLMAVNCHHNYVAREHHFNENVLVTRKGAVRARQGDFGIIPGSMGTKSYIVKGKGNEDSFNSCSHGAGRRMSRTAARKKFTIEDLKSQTAGVECRKDADVIDEIPGAYKDIDEVIENQTDLVEVVSVLKQIMCIKG